MDISPLAIARAVGYFPPRTLVEVANCPVAGTDGHYHCGWCAEHQKPRVRCGCRTHYPHEIEGFVEWQQRFRHLLDFIYSHQREIFLRDYPGGVIRPEEESLDELDEDEIPF